MHDCVLYTVFSKLVSLVNIVKGTQSCFFFSINSVDDSVAGTWYNELQSEISIDEYSEGPGRLRGYYQTAVGNVPSNQKYHLVGTYDTSGDASKGTIAFTVQWLHGPDGDNLNSTTAWSGQRIKLNESGEGAISTTWLLTTQEKVEDLWSATNIGTNVFTREKTHVQKNVTPLPIHCCHPKKIHPQ